jgi:SAM-dependent methyltransferase
MRRKRLRAGVFNKTIQGDAARLPFPDGQFETVIAIELIEHLTKPGALLEECYRILGSDGSLWLKTPNRLPHDFFEAIRGRFFTCRKYHPSVLWHRRLESICEGVFDIEFYYSGLAEYQVEKIDNQVSGLGKTLDLLPLSHFPRVCHPSIQARLTPA